MNKRVSAVPLTIPASVSVAALEEVEEEEEEEEE